MDNNYYRQNLEPVVAASWFIIDPGTYIYASVTHVHDAEKHLQVIRDGHELTVVTDVSNLPLKDSIITNKEKWKLINIRCGNPFYCIGFIAHIADTLAIAGIDMVVTSSFSNDLVMVMEADLAKAVSALVQSGFSKK